MSIDISRVRIALQAFDFRKLFVEELGWGHAPKGALPSLGSGDDAVTCRYVAQLAGIPVIEVEGVGGALPGKAQRIAVHKELSKTHFENLLIFVNRGRTQSLWYWVKHGEGKHLAREHYYTQGQPGDLIISKLADMFVDIADLDDEGNIDVLAVVDRLRMSLDVEAVTKRFYQAFSARQLQFIESIEGVPDEHDRRWYASVLLNRLMFVWFLQRKGFLNGADLNYLGDRLAKHRSVHTKKSFFRDFLQLLFFEGFAKPEDKRSPEARKRLGDIRYLNGGLFLPHPVEVAHPALDVPDEALEQLFDLFSQYSWNLDDTPGGQDNEINPDVLGYIFEKYINEKAFGAYYTRPEITEYLCERTIHRLILDAVNSSEAEKKHLTAGERIYQYESVAEMLMNLDALTCKRLLHEILPGLSLLDPACGSGAFLVAAMKTLIDVYSAAIGRIEFLNSPELSDWLAKVKREHSSVAYFIKKRIITDNLYGVDIMEEAVEIAKLRLFLALVATVSSAVQLEPLPNIDFNILCGNSLVGMLRVSDEEFANGRASVALFRRGYREILEEKNRLIDSYRHATTYAEDLSALRADIEVKRREALATLNGTLLDAFDRCLIKYEQATWDAAKGTEGKPKKRALELADIERLTPFHWGYEFDRILNQRGGFDAIITNPPWEIFKPNAKEFFERHSDVVTKKKMTIHEFEKEKKKLLEDPELRAAWLEYLSEFPHVSAFYRTADQYRNQVSIVDGKKAGSDLNLYKLFTEQCCNLLRDGGLCGIVIPSGIYTDLGTKQLREMLFGESEVTGLFCFENRKAIFEDVHRSFKFVVLTFRKGGTTDHFPAAFMRHDVKELEHFPRHGAIDIAVSLVRKLSPASLSVMEFKAPLDVRICEKATRFPLLGEQIDDAWNLALTREFDMTNDSALFKTAPGKGCLPLYEGKMIHQYQHDFSAPRYWVEEAEGRRAILGRSQDVGQQLGYQRYRLAHRSIGRSTDARTMIATVLPKMVFYGHSLNAQREPLSGAEMLFILASLDSLVLDYVLRTSVSANLTMFFIYQLPLPRLSREDAAFAPIVERSARLICTTAEFDELAKEVGLKSHRDGVTEPAARARLRAELDGLVAHLYGLTEEEFAHILSTFPLVPDPVKVAAQNAYRDVDRGLVK